MIRLLDQAREAHRSGQFGRSRRYVKMAFELLKKHRIRLPKDLRNSFCRKCFTIWIPAKTVTVNYDKNNHCLRLRCSCGRSKRF